MNYLKKVPVIVSILIITAAGLFCIYYLIATIHNSSPSSLDITEISSIKDEIKYEYPNVKDFSAYYRFSRVNFDLTLTDSAPADEITEIVQKIRELILQENLVNKLSTKDNPSVRIHLVLNCGKDVYEYEGNREESEYYKIWHFRKNGGDETSIVFN